VICEEINQSGQKKKKKGEEMGVLILLKGTFPKTVNKEPWEGDLDVGEKDRTFPERKGFLLN